MEEMDIQLFFLAPITPTNFTSKNTDPEYPSPVAHAANHYRSSHNPLAMIKISISCVYCPQKMETVASNIITCCLRCELLFTHHHVIHWHNLPLPLQIFLLVITQPWK
jgi:hypothetical protein